MVEELERTYDEGLERGSFLQSPESGTDRLPPGEDLARDVERFFREGGSSPPREP